MMPMDPYHDWEGNIDELADTAAEILRKLGRSDVMPPNVRLIRDYAQRGILSQGDRRGKEVYYGFQHLKELVAARILVSEGVPLAKIAEQFDRDRDIVIVTLGVSGVADSHPLSEAKERWRSLGPGPPHYRNRTKPASAPASAAFMQRAFEDAGQKMELHQRLRRLGAESRGPEVDQVARIKITDWCWLLVDAHRLRGLSLEEADDIGRIIAAALTDPRIKKGEPS